MMAKKRHVCNRDGCYWDTLVCDLHDLAHCYDGAKTAASDVDYLFHRQVGDLDYFQVFEIKPKNQEMSDGQRIVLEGLSRLPRWWVGVCYLADPSDLKSIVAFRRIKQGACKERTPCDFATLEFFCRCWDRNTQTEGGRHE